MRSGSSPEGLRRTDSVARRVDARPAGAHVRQPAQTDATSALQAILSSANTNSPGETSMPAPGSSHTSTTTTPTGSRSNSADSQMLKRQIESLRIQADGSERLLASTTNSLKEFGDLQTYAEVVWRDMFVLEEVMALADSGIIGAEEAIEDSYV